MKFVKIDPITGEMVATGACPDEELLPEMDHEGLLIFRIEGEPHEVEFDHGSMSLIRKDMGAVVELRRRLAAEKRLPTSDELAVVGRLAKERVL